MEDLRTRTKTFRFAVTTLTQLKDAAERANMTENELVNQAVARRLLVDPLFPTFRKICLDSDTMSRLISAANVDVLETTASELAQRDFPVVRRLYKTRHRPLEFIDFLTDVLAKAAQWFTVEGQEGGAQKQLVLHHRYGLKWSLYLKSYITSAFSTISRDRLRIEIDDQFVVVGFESSWGEVNPSAQCLEIINEVA